MTDLSEVDNPPWLALTGDQASLGTRLRRAATFDADVSPFAAVADPTDPHAWADLAELVGSGTSVTVVSSRPLAVDWDRTFSLPGVRFTGTRVEGAVDPEPLVLGPADVPEMIDLVERTKPGPFLKRTIEMGTYVGFRVGGALVAMAGERFRTPGWTEISAVCVDPSARGRGLAQRLIRVVVGNVRESGREPFLHTGAQNAPAIALYHAMGFDLVAEPHFSALTVP